MKHWGNTQMNRHVANYTEHSENALNLIANTTPDGSEWDDLKLVLLWKFMPYSRHHHYKSVFEAMKNLVERIIEGSDQTRMEGLTSMLT